MNYIRDKNVTYPTFNYYHPSSESFTVEVKEDYGFVHLLANSLIPSEE